jgi:4-hydroxybenzoate polyprenyltransferase
MIVRVWVLPSVSPSLPSRSSHYLLSLSSCRLLASRLDFASFGFVGFALEFLGFSCGAASGCALQLFVDLWNSRRHPEIRGCFSGWINRKRGFLLHISNRWSIMHMHK